MRTKTLSLGRPLRNFLASRQCWWLVLGLFWLEALWFVVSARYPMAFDENYHFGLIQLHAHQWLPFFTSQPNGASVYGAIVRDPSYLYHWLMSFPYRLVSAFTGSQVAHILVLRLINVALFTCGLILGRRIMRRLGASHALVNSVLAAFVLLPVVPFLAATINYDNLFFIAALGVILLTIHLLRGVKTAGVDAPTLLVWLTLVLLGCLIKYPFLPVAAVSGLYVAWRFWRGGLFGAKGWRSFTRSFLRLPAAVRIGLVVLCVVSFGLFVERYGQNIVVYHNPVPACDAVISEDDCVRYGPFARDFHLSQSKSASFHANIFVYAWEWLWGMWFRLYFAISDTYDTRPPLFIVSRLGTLGAVLLAIGIALRFKWLFAGHEARKLVAWIILAYGLALFLDGFSAYRKTGQPVAINGRYLVPFLPFLLVLGGLAWSNLLQRYQAAKIWIAGAVIAIMLLQGGGALTFLIRSNDVWMWDNDVVQMVNRTLRSIAWPFIIGKNW